ncbi:hypothetical protein ACHAXM_005690 [Skeletonema potamos]
MLCSSRNQERPYHSDSTASRLLSEVKHCRARLVLRWGTTLESLVLFFWFFTFWCKIQWEPTSIFSISSLAAHRIVWYVP